MAGLLSAVAVPYSGSVALDNLNAIDWAQFDSIGSPTNRKSGGGSLIGAASFWGGAGGGAATDNPRTMSWTGGTPNATGSNTNNGYAGTSSNTQGWQITAPADTTERTLRLYIGSYNCRILVNASLSDGSATALSSFVTGIFWSGSQVYVGFIDINYRADAASQTLTVTVGCDNAGSFSNVGLQAAALFAPSGLLSLDGDTNTDTTADLTTGSIDWAQFGNSAGAPTERKNGGGGLVSTVAGFGGANATYEGGTPRSIGWTDGTPTGSNTVTQGTYFASFDTTQGGVFSVSLSTTPRLYRLHVNAYNGRARVGVVTSDSAKRALGAGSTSILGTSSTVDSGYVDITLAASGTGQQAFFVLTISDFGTFSNVGLQAVEVRSSSSGLTVAASQTAAATTQASTLVAVETISAAQTAAATTQAATLVNRATVAAAQTAAATTQTATVIHPALTAAAAQTAAVTTQTATLVAAATVAAAQTAAATTQAATLVAVATLAAAQTAAATTQAATITTGVATATVTAAQTAEAATQAATLVARATVAAAQTAEATTQSATLVRPDARAVTAAQTAAATTQTATLVNRVLVAAAQAAEATSQAATLSVRALIAAAQTAAATTQDATIARPVTGLTAAQTAAPTTQSALVVTFFGLQATQIAEATSQVAALVARATLAAAQTAAATTQVVFIGKNYDFERTQRTLVVGAEQRVLILGAEGRMLTLDAEDRVLVLGGEDRTLYLDGDPA